MSYFIALAFSSKVRDFSGDFDAGIRLKDISLSPFGMAVTGGKRGDYQAFLVTLYGDSSELLDKGYARNNQSRSIVVAIERLLKKSPTVALCFHWARGDVEAEEVSLKEKEVLPFEKFRDAYPDLREDVLYVVVSESRFDVD